MTRINVGVPPRDLHRLHLIAEHREIVRVPKLVKKYHGRIDFSSIPKQFTLGTGHVKFFYNKLLYLKNRYLELLAECKRRGYNMTDMSDSWQDVPDVYMQDYTPTEKDREIILERINSKLQDKKKFKDENNMEKS